MITAAFTLSAIAVLLALLLFATVRNNAQKFLTYAGLVRDAFARSHYEVQRLREEVAGTRLLAGMVSDDLSRTEDTANTTRAMLQRLAIELDSRMGAVAFMNFPPPFSKEAREFLYNPELLKELDLLPPSVPEAAPKTACPDCGPDCGPAQ